MADLFENDWLWTLLCRAQSLHEAVFGRTDDSREN